MTENIPNQALLNDKCRKQSNFLHNDVFESIPKNYDLFNRLFTLGMDVGWRNKAARESLKAKPQSVLDICCGTGDLALTVAKFAKYDLQVTGLDYSQPMLNVAIEKAQKNGYNVDFVNGDIANIPFPDNSFDCLCIGFGFRNLTYKNGMAERHIAEILRVLKPGGRFVIAESSQPRPNARVIRYFHRRYLKHFIPFIGKLVSGNRIAYTYLGNSAANYYGAEELSDLLLRSGFSAVTFKRLFVGAAAIHVAVK
jgi:demethylmenaquinone methyltransferase/2-methoxy-6-polyprenyl-1,4-benzoquinol methylase